MKKIIELDKPTQENVRFKASNGGYVFAHVYSRDEGNYLIKGLYKSVMAYLEKRKYWFANITWFHKGEQRKYWIFWKDGVYISEPRIGFEDKFFLGDKGKYLGWTKYKVTDLTDHIYYFKRIPNKWIDKFNKL